MANKLAFLKDFESDLVKMEIEEGASQPPRYWYSIGNYVVNKTLSGSFMNGVAQGRITGLAGPSGSGKSFLVGNAIREAQKAGAYILVLDSENALDDDFVGAIGVDTDKSGYKYVPVNTIPQVNTVVSKFLKGYKDEYERGDVDAPQVLICIDSLDMLSTETENENFEKGITKGDMGQRSRQMKAMLRQFVNAIKHYNISMLLTTQVYKNQDLTNGEGVWIIGDAIKFAMSNIAMLTRLKLRGEDKTDRSVLGIRMTVEGYKTRFTKPFQKVTIEVPYDTGMDPYNGLFEVAQEMGIIQKKGSWYVFDGGDNFRSDDFGTIASDVLIKCEANRTKYLAGRVSDDEELVIEEQPTHEEKVLAKKEKAKAKLKKAD